LGPVPPLENLVGRSLHDVYKIVRPIGRGGMGAIYEAEHLRLAGKRYAVKVLHREFAESPELLQRFRREAEIASALGHDHIVEVHDFNITADGLAYMVMELLLGEDLAARLKRGPLPLDTALAIAGQTASALEASHRAHIVHRDLKPQNLFLCHRGGREDFVKVLDFGVSKVLDSASAITREDALVGTPFYMSPEQAAGRVADIEARTDVFALAAIVWEMLTGQMAFGGSNHAAVLYRVLFAEPPDVHTLRPDVPPAVSLVLRRALAKDRQARTPSMNTFFDEFVSAASGSAPAASRPSAPSPWTAIASRSLPPQGAGGDSLATQAAPAPVVSVGREPSPAISTAPPDGARTPPARRSRAGWAVAALLVVGAAAGVTLVWTQHRPSTPSAVPTPTPAPGQAPIPAPQAAPAPPAEATIRFVVKPATATVKVDGVAVDGTEVRVPRRPVPLNVIVEARGYRPERRTVVPDGDREVAVSLRRRAATPPPARAPSMAAAVEPPPAPRPPQPQAIAPDSRPQTPPPKKRTGTLFDIEE
jgi:serine/threonine protein kinase